MSSRPAAVPTSSSALSLALLSALLLVGPLAPSPVLGVPVDTQTHATASSPPQAQTSAASATPAHAIDDELALVIDVPAAAASDASAASSADASRPVAPVRHAFDDDLEADADAESSLVLVGTCSVQYSITCIAARLSSSRIKSTRTTLTSG